MSVRHGTNGAIEPAGGRSGRIGADAAAGWFAACRAREEANAPHWIPVLIGVGIAAHFALPEPPPFWLSLAVPGALVAAAALLGLRASAPTALVATAVCFAVGVAAAGVRTERVAAPVIERETGPLTVTGRILWRDARGSKRIQLLIEPATVGRMTPDDLPDRVRISAHRGQAGDVRAGDFIRIRAVLRPPPGPVAPGAFDFARKAWFERLGGVGFAISDATPTSGSPPALSVRLSTTIERLRDSIAERIITRLGPVRGAIAAALLTGKRGAIPEDTLQAIRDAGLAHLLAISGLHMALVCGTVFSFAGLLLAASPWLGIRIVVKKWAAVAALAAGTGYYLLAGGSVATERAFIMAGVALVAVLIDRPAITMRNVALAAVIVLLLRPESIADAGFQMSFGAVVALVAFYDWVRTRRMGRERPPRHWAPVRLIAISILAVAATTVIATMATGPIAAFHFNRVAVFGLAANLVAVPLVGSVVMPLGLLALLLMPLGLDGWALDLMGHGTGIVIDTAAAIAGLDGAVVAAPAPHWAALPLFAVGGLWICLWRASWRWLGIVPVLLSFALAGTAPRPDLLVARDARNVALRGDDGRLVAAIRRVEAYSVDQWLRRDGDATRAPAPPDTMFRCDSEACAATATNGARVAYALRRSAFAEECRRADILVSRIPVRTRCPSPSIIIDISDIRRRGPHAVHLGAGPYGTDRVETAADHRSGWPWNPWRSRGGSPAGVQ